MWDWRVFIHGVGTGKGHMTYVVLRCDPLRASAGLAHAWFFWSCIRCYGWVFSAAGESCHGHELNVDGGFFKADGDRFGHPEAVDVVVFKDDFGVVVECCSGKSNIMCVFCMSFDSAVLKVVG